MKIFGLVVAIETEINALLESGCEFKKVDDKTYEVYETTINENKLYVIHSGCGEVFAGIATQYLITKYNVEFIFNYGIYGRVLLIPLAVLLGWEYFRVADDYP